MANVRLIDVQKIYSNGFEAIHNINLEIKDGEFMVIVGPSGCAKSTILRMIAGLEEISKGKILIGEKIVNNISPKDRKIAMVFQNYALYPHMTVYENMAFGMKILKISDEKIDKRVREIAEKLEILNLLDRKPSEISGGQKQRVALGRAMIRKPEVFLFDEPLSSLDAKLRISMRTKIKQLHRQLKLNGDNSTMIYVTHDQSEAMTMGDRICVINKGEIMQVDTPINLYKKPLNKFVAGFIGSPTMNFIVGELKNVEENAVFSFMGYNIILDIYKEKLKNYFGKKIILGIRAENIKIGNSSYLKNNLFDGNIETVEYMGNEKIIYFKFEKINLISRVNEGENFFEGEKIKFYFDVNNIHIFDFETEKNLII